MRFIDADAITKDSEAVTAFCGLFKKCGIKHTSACIAPTCEDCVARFFKHYEHLMPTVDAEPVKCGKWDCVNNDENIYTCTSCGDAMALDAGMSPEDYGFDFCPFCGARLMRVKKL